jgi:hypothetical protein
MTHSHEDRIAERPAGMCAAYGCPLHGSMSDSTTGGDTWWCSLHFGKEADELQRVTRSLNENRWLAEVVTAVLEIHPARGDEFRAKTAAWVRQTLTANGREDLQWSGQPETTRQWSNRLKRELERLVAVRFTKPEQKPLNDSRETWTKASNLFPSWA